MRPPQFESYWDNIDTELATIPGQPVLEELSMRSNEFATVYALTLTSIGPYRIFGYLTIPIGAGPFPALIQTPRYGSVNHIPDYNDRLRYICLQIMHRGQRRADEPYAARYPGLLTDGIDDPDDYIYRGIIADCLRGTEYLLSRADVDGDRVAIQGDDLAIITAARRSGISFVNASGLMFYQLPARRQETSAYPFEEINDYCRRRPESEAEVDRTLAFFDPLYHADKVTADLLLSVGGEAEHYAALNDSLAGRFEMYTLTHRGGADHDAVDALVAERLGVDPMSRFIRTFEGETAD